MKTIISSFAFCMIAISVCGQGLVKIGDDLPNYNFTKLINAPLKKIDISELKGKPIAIAFWGTWCAPCISEIVNLSKLQIQFGDKLQIIGVSNDNEEKLNYFLKKRPSRVWFASDPSQNLWNIFGINTAGHTALIDNEGKIVSITETSFIDSNSIKNLIDKKNISLQEKKGERPLLGNEDPIKLDSSTIYSFVMQPQLKGIAAMMKRPVRGVFSKRRITIINLTPTVILREAFDIAVAKRIIYATKEDSIKSIQNPLCIDFIISENEKSNLNTLFQKELNNHLPVKGEMQKRTIPCYTLKRIEGKEMTIKTSTNSENRFSFNGLEFEGEGIPIRTFIDYIENELNFPIYDATGLTNFYDITFSRNNIEPLQSTNESLAKLGFELIKDQKEMDVLVISSK